MSAGVHSIAALEDLKASLTTFETEGKESLSVIGMDVRRGLEWFTHDLLKYWQTQIRKREDEVNNARADLERCRMQKYGDRTPDCTDQKVALKKAQARLEEAQQKVQAVKKWSRVLEEEAEEYRAQAQQLESIFSGELPKANAELARMLTALEGYIGVRAPSGGSEFSMANPGSGGQGGGQGPEAGGQGAGAAASEPNQPEGAQGDDGHAESQPAAETA
ncbi:MAG TPA: hypothetical protein VFW87_17965 [Pirellulales bacterium]|nr:hypothetical protein [Pirellulales bacterium]